MKVAIRADASTLIGSGHVVRCRTLAEALSGRGADIMFLCRLHENNLVDQLRGAGFAVASLPLGNPHTPGFDPWLGHSVDGDAHDTRGALEQSGFAPDWLVVDHYGLDAQWEDAVRSNARVMVIDDIADRRHHCDLLLDQNLISGWQHRYEGLVRPGTTQLLGPKYALLQPRYATIHEAARNRKPGTPRILVYFGAADTMGLTLQVVEALRTLRDHLEIDVVIGSANPFRSRIAIAVDGDSRFRLHDSMPSLAELMLTADLAVGASGATSWERICLFLPALIATLAENQRPIADEIDRLRLARLLGAAADLTTTHWRDAIVAALAPGGLDWFDRDLAETIDGLGTGRVVEALIERTTGQK